MLYKIEIHSTELQDHDGFFTFLNAHSHDGLEAVRVYRSFTIFKKTDSPPAGYSMHFSLITISWIRTESQGYKTG